MLPEFDVSIVGVRSGTSTVRVVADDMATAQALIQAECEADQCHCPPQCCTDDIESTVIDVRQVVLDDVTLNQRRRCRPRHRLRRQHTPPQEAIRVGCVRLHGMRGGEPHDLNPVVDEPQTGRAVNYRRRKWGEGYQVRISAPSCRIRFLVQIEQLEAPYDNLQPAARRALLDVLTRRTFKWPRPARDAMLDQYEGSQAWKAEHTRAENRRLAGTSLRRNWTRSRLPIGHLAIVYCEVGDFETGGSI